MVCTLADCLSVLTVDLPMCRAVAPIVELELHEAFQHDDQCKPDCQYLVFGPLGCLWSIAHGFLWKSQSPS